MEVSKTPNKKEDTTMKRKKFLALALAGVLTAVTLTACAPLEVLYDWFFGGGGSASRGNGVNLVEVSPGQKSQIVRWFGLNDGMSPPPTGAGRPLRRWWASWMLPCWIPTIN